MKKTNISLKVLMSALAVVALSAACIQPPPLDIGDTVDSLVISTEEVQVAVGGVESVTVVATWSTGLVEDVAALVGWTADGSIIGNSISNISINAGEIAGEYAGTVVMFATYEGQNSQNVTVAIIGDPSPFDFEFNLGFRQKLKVRAPGATGAAFWYDTQPITPFANTMVGSIYIDQFLGEYAELVMPTAQLDDPGTNYWYVEVTSPFGTTRFPASGELTFTVAAMAPVASTPFPADTETFANFGTLINLILKIEAPGATAGTFYYDNDDGNPAIDWSESAEISGTQLSAVIYPAPDKFEAGDTFWYVEVLNPEGTTRFPAVGELSFTVTP